jgi:AraC-like DNA-binding protein
LRRATLEELAIDPAGKYVSGRCFAHFCAAPGLWGVVLWGRPDGVEAFALGRSLLLEIAPPAVPHVSIFDASRLGGSDPDAFRAAERFVRELEGALGAFIRRLALLRPAGISGAVIAGAFDVLPKPFPVLASDDPDAAFEWLAEERDPGGWWPDDGPAMLADLYAEVVGTPAALPRLRDHLDANLAGAGLEDAARSLGVSTRTLQRQLGEADTTFTAELTAARIRAARRLLVETEASLTEIAMDVGCKSLQQFSALFRREVGESPSAFRARRL